MYETESREIVGGMGRERERGRVEGVERGSDTKCERNGGERYIKR